MPKFKVGDKVRCINTDGSDLLQVGSEYDVAAVGHETVLLSDGFPDLHHESIFELVTDEREPKQGEMVEARRGQKWRKVKFIIKYGNTYICEATPPYLINDKIHQYDMIRPIKQKDTLQSVFEELKDCVERKTSPKNEGLKNIVKRMETFIADKPDQ